MEFETKKIKIPIDCDLSLMSLFNLIDYLSKNFKFNPRTVVVRVSLEQLINAVEIRRILKNIQSFLGFVKTMLFNPILIKMTWGKSIYFGCDRDLLKDYWEISCLKNNILYIVYSEGA